MSSTEMPITRVLLHAFSEYFVKMIVELSIVALDFDRYATVCV